MAPLREPEDKWLVINNLNLHYLDWGGDSDRPLVLLHGITSHAHFWDFFARNFSRNFRIYALDQRGHGESDHTRDGYAITKFVSDIAEFVKALGLEKFDLCGLSLGGRNAIGYAGTYPETVKHLIIVDIGPEMPLAGAKELNTRIVSPPMGFRSEDEAVEYYRQYMTHASREMLRLRAIPALRRNWADKLVFKHDPDVSWITGSAGKKEIPLIWDLLAKITCPTLVMRGAESDLLSPEIAQRMISVLPNRQYVEIPDSGHVIPMDNPAAFEAEAKRFLES